MALGMPVSPMLARLARALPDDADLLFEPKWDGFRCLAVRAGDEVALWSRHGRPLGRYFPELVAALRALPAVSWTLDGEVVLRRGDRSDFPALMARLHPAASRVARLAVETPAVYIAFDALAVDGRDLRAEPFRLRREALERLVADGSNAVRRSPTTSDRALAEAWLASPPGSGIDGVVAKHADAPYEPGRRAMVKVKTERTADCVVAGLRQYADQPEVGSLLLGLYDDDGVLRHVGIATSFDRKRRRQLVDELAPSAVPLHEHPWRRGFALEGGPTGRLRGAAARWTPEMVLDWVPLRPVHVLEVAYDQLDGLRFRHPARFRRWRPDRDPASCTVDQLREAA